MKLYKVLGIDPGLANTGVALIQGSSTYKLITADHIETSKDQELGERLESIYSTLHMFVGSRKSEIDFITIERCFHNKNISASAGTFQVIGLVHLIGKTFGMPVIEVTPQQVKTACGLGSRAKKDEILRVAKVMFGKEFANHHTGDGAFAAIAGILKTRSESRSR